MPLRLCRLMVIVLGFLLSADLPRPVFADEMELAGVRATHLRVFQPKEILEFADGRFVWRSPEPGYRFLEMRGRVMLGPHGRFGPLRLVDTALSGQDRNGAPWRSEDLVAVGTEAHVCQYLPLRSVKAQSIRVQLRSGGSFELSRSRPDDSVTLTVDAPSIDLCLAFATRELPAASLRLHFGQASVRVLATPRRLDYAMTMSAGAGFAALGGVDRSGKRQPAIAPQSTQPRSYAVMAAIVAAVGSAVLAALLLTRIPLRRQAAQPDKSPESKPAPFEIPRVKDIHRRDLFTPVEKDGGAGQQQFAQAMEAIYLADDAGAAEKLHRALELGLPATYECGAWAHLGMISMRKGDLAGMMTGLLRSLESRQLTREAAFVAAVTLFRAYQTLGLRADASAMRSVAQSANPDAMQADLPWDRQITALALEYRDAHLPSRARRLGCWLASRLSRHTPSAPD